MDLLSEIALDLVKSVDVPGVENERFLANGIGTYPQGETNMGIVDESHLVQGRDEAVARILDGFESEKRQATALGP